jgi:hypothetical protein
VGLLVTLWGMMEGLLNSTAWFSLIVYAVFLAGALYYVSAGGKETR